LPSAFQGASCVDSHDSSRATRIIHPENSQGATIRSFSNGGAGQACPTDRTLGSPRIEALDEPPPLTSWPLSRSTSLTGSLKRVSSVWVMIAAQRSVQSSYATRSQRRWRLRPPSPSRAVLRCFAHCVRPIACEWRTRFFGGQSYLTHTAQRAARAETDGPTLYSTVSHTDTVKSPTFPRPLFG
jgi:hypothetical protein